MNFCFHYPTPFHGKNAKAAIENFSRNGTGSFLFHHYLLLVQIFVLPIPFPAEIWAK
jgi:hypothetical protein